VRPKSSFKGRGVTQKKPQPWAAHSSGPGLVKHFQGSLHLALATACESGPLSTPDPTIKLGLREVQAFPRLCRS
jgi:hypothetical protein